MSDEFRNLDNFEVGSIWRIKDSSKVNGPFRRKYIVIIRILKTRADVEVLDKKYRGQIFHLSNTDIIEFIKKSQEMQQGDIVLVSNNIQTNDWKSRKLKSIEVTDEHTLNFEVYDDACKYKYAVPLSGNSHLQSAE